MHETGIRRGTRGGAQLTEVARAFRDKTAVGEVGIGLRVVAAYEDITDEITLLQFKPDAEASGKRHV